MIRNTHIRQTEKLTGVTDGIGTVQTVTYDADGNAASTTNGAGETASYTYDKDGRCTSVTVSRIENGETLTFTSTTTTTRRETLSRALTTPET